MVSVLESGGEHWSTCSNKNKRTRSDCVSTFPRIYFPLSFSQQSTPPHSRKPPAVTNVPLFQLHVKWLPIGASLPDQFPKKKHNCILLLNIQYRNFTIQKRFFKNIPLSNLFCVRAFRYHLVNLIEQKIWILDLWASKIILYLSIWIDSKLICMDPATVA